MRRIYTHEVTGADAEIRIEAADDPGAGGAHHVYDIDLSHQPVATTRIYFQEGPVAEHGVNGITQEALLAIVIDRLRCFQAGKFACRENAIALTHIETGLLWLQQRTRERIARGVEGTSEK